MGGPGFYAKMHDATGISEYLIRMLYNLKETRKRLRFLVAEEKDDVGRVRV